MELPSDSSNPTVIDRSVLNGTPFCEMSSLLIAVMNRDRIVGSVTLIRTRSSTVDESVTTIVNLAASGTVTAFGSGKGSSGEGTDSRGRLVQFTVGGRQL